MSVRQVALAFVAVVSEICGASVPNGVLTVSVEGEQDGYSSEQLAQIQGGSVTEIRKIGAGTLVSKGIADFAGQVRVAEGVLKVVDATGLGTAAGETVVEAGATLHFASLAGDYATYKAERYVIAGDGYNASPAETNGAIRITGATCQLSHLTLSEDAAICSEKGFHFYDDGDSTFEMNGKTLRLHSPESGNLDVEWRFDAVSNPGSVEIHGARYFRPAASLLTGGAVHELRLYGRTGLLLDSATTNQDWKIVRFGTGGFYQPGSDGTWNGALENRNLDSPMGLTVGQGKTLTLNGPVTGAGSFMKDANLGAVVLNGINDFTGTFEARGGKVVLGRPEAAAGSVVDRFNFSNLTVDLGLTGQTANWADGWTAEQVTNVVETVRAAQKPNVSVSLHAVAGDAFDVAATFDSDYTGIRLGAIAGGATRYLATLLDRPKFCVSTDADLVLTCNPDVAGVNTLGTSSVIKGFLSLQDMGFVDVAGQNLTVGSNKSSDLAGLKVGGQTVLSCGGASGMIGVPYEADVRGVCMEVTDAAVVSNRLQISVGSTQSSGALYLRGGVFYAPYSGSNLGYIGGRGDGYVEVSGGEFVCSGYLHLGVFVNGVGQLHVGSGSFASQTTPLYVGDAGTGVVYQTGGQIAVASDLHLPSRAFENDKSSGLGIVTVAGGTMELSGVAIVNNRAAGTGILNLNGGTLAAQNVVGQGSTEDAKGFLNFKGGTFRLVADQTALFKGLNRVTAWGEAVIDTDGHAATLATPLSAPAAGGIASITLSGAFDNVVSPPVVTIVGDGEGASAVATFDSTTRTVTGIVVTSPGWGYTREKTTVVAAYRGYPGTVVPCTFTLADSATATPVTLVKRGAGTLTLSPDALPAGASVRTEGGVLAIDGAWPTGLTIRLPENPVAGRRYTLATAESFPDGVPALAAGDVLPDGWCVKIVGNRVRFAEVRGMAVILR